METPQHCCSVTLIVLGDDLEPDQVSAMLGWSTDQCWRRGEHKRYTRPDGTERVFDTIHDRGGWKCFGPDHERERSLHDQFTAWLQRLMEKGPALRALRQRGWEIELDCFAATSEYMNFRVGALTELGRLGVDVAITFSPDVASNVG